MSIYQPYQRIRFVLMIITFSTLALAAQNLRFEPQYIAAIEPQHGPAIIDQCSRSKPHGVKKYWKVGKEELEVLQDNFKKIYDLKATDCCWIKGKISDLGKYAFQIVGVVIKARRYIYLNSIEVVLLNERMDSLEDWKTNPVVICDGGDSFWGALFDVKKKTF